MARADFNDDGNTTDEGRGAPTTVARAPQSNPKKIKSEETPQIDADDSEIESFNGDHCVICVEGKMRILRWHDSLLYPGRREFVLMSIDDFKLMYRQWKKVVMHKVLDEDGNPTGEVKARKKPFADYWLAHENCKQFNKGYAFMPEIDAPEINGYMNLYTGLAVNAAPGDWSLFKRHIIDNLCDGNEEHAEYLFKWMAWIVQNRKRSEVCVLLRSDEEGTGKGFFAKHFGKLFGPHYMQVTNSEHVIGKFNPHLQYLLLLDADEALFANNHRHRNALWGLITEETLTIEPKNFNPYKALNFLNVIITTNSRHAVKVGRTARRIFALTVATHQMQNTIYFEAVADQLAAGGYGAMLADLQAMDLTGFDVRNCPKTATLNQQKEMSRDGTTALVEECLHNAVLPFAHPDFPDVMLTSAMDDKNGFDEFIRKHPDNEVKHRRPLGVKRDLRADWAVTNWRDHSRFGYAFPPLAEMRAKFERLHNAGQPIKWLSDATQWDAR